MPFILFEQAKFTKQFKKLPFKVQVAVEDQIELILEDPTIGEKKIGDLSFLRVHKFKIGVQLYLLAYMVDEAKGELYLYAVATHENFYRDIKRYLR